MARWGDGPAHENMNASDFVEEVERIMQSEPKKYHCPDCGRPTLPVDDQTEVSKTVDAANKSGDEPIFCVVIECRECGRTYTLTREN